MSVTHHLHLHRHTPSRRKAKPEPLPGVPTAIGGRVLLGALILAISGWAIGFSQIISDRHSANIELWTALSIGSALFIFVLIIWKSFRA